MRILRDPVIKPEHRGRTFDVETGEEEHAPIIKAEDRGRTFNLELSNVITRGTDQGNAITLSSDEEDDEMLTSPRALVRVARLRKVMVESLAWERRTGFD
ncbi:hypothetical protein HD806DRAFT_529323 [Xylariaceae sp. AK1471]|nr:hypothetical protein HD806DRAFT_529323 [Xylariaceae sp. AK1471]